MSLRSVTSDEWEQIKKHFLRNVASADNPSKERKNRRDLLEGMKGTLSPPFPIELLAENARGFVKSRQRGKSAWLERIKELIIEMEEVTHLTRLAEPFKLPPAHVNIDSAASRQDYMNKIYAKWRRDNISVDKPIKYFAERLWCTERTAQKDYTAAIEREGTFVSAKHTIELKLNLAQIYAILYELWENKERSDGQPTFWVDNENTMLQILSQLSDRDRRRLFEISPNQAFQGYLFPHLEKQPSAEFVEEQEVLKKILHRLDDNSSYYRCDPDLYNDALMSFYKFDLYKPHMRILLKDGTLLEGQPLDYLFEKRSLTLQVDRSGTSEEVTVHLNDIEHWDISMSS